MKKTGEVIRLDHGCALVKMQRGAGCGAEKCPLSAPLLDDYGAITFQVRAHNPLNASPGDAVLVEVADRTALLIAFCLYLLPILLTFTAYFLVRMMTDSVVVTTGSVVAALIVSVVILKRLDQTIQPRYNIVEFVDREAICSSCPLTAKQRKSELEIPE